MTRQFLDDLLGEVRRRFYAEADDRTFYAQRRWLIKALTWPAGWLLRKHGFREEVTPANYRKIIITVLDDIQRHGRAEFGESGYFPAYLLKCIQDHCRLNADAVLWDFKQLRNRVDFTSLVSAIKSSSRPDPAAGCFVDTLAEAHTLLAAPKRRPAAGRALATPDRQLALL